jgi:hypothetical protein
MSGIQLKYDTHNPAAAGGVYGVEGVFRYILYGVNCYHIVCIDFGLLSPR